MAQGPYTPRSHPITLALSLKPLFHSNSTSTPIPEPPLREEVTPHCPYLPPLLGTPTSPPPPGLQMGPELSRRLSEPWSLSGIFVLSGVLVAVAAAVV